MATRDTIQLDDQDLPTIALEAPPPGGSTQDVRLADVDVDDVGLGDVRLGDVRLGDVREGVETTIETGPEATAYLDIPPDLARMSVSRAFDPFPAHPSQDDPEVSAAFKRLDLVEVRLARIEKRLMEISLLIARNFSATLETPLGVPDVLEPVAPHFVGEDDPVAAASPSVPRQTRGKRDRDLDDALESFLNSLSPTANMTRQ